MTALQTTQAQGESISAKRQNLQTRMDVGRALPIPSSVLADLAGIQPQENPCWGLNLIVTLPALHGVRSDTRVKYVVLSNARVAGLAMPAT